MWGKIRKRAAVNRPLWPNAIPLRLRRNKLFFILFYMYREKSFACNVCIDGILSLFQVFGYKNWNDQSGK